MPNQRNTQMIAVIVIMAIAGSMAVISMMPIDPIDRTYRVQVVVTFTDGSTALDVSSTKVWLSYSDPVEHFPMVEQSADGLRQIFLSDSTWDYEGNPSVSLQFADGGLFPVRYGPLSVPIWNTFEEIPSTDFEITDQARGLSIVFSVVFA